MNSKKCLSIWMFGFFYLLISQNHSILKNNQIHRLCWIYSVSTDCSQIVNEFYHWFPNKIGLIHKNHRQIYQKTCVHICRFDNIQDNHYSTKNCYQLFQNMDLFFYLFNKVYTKREWVKNPKTLLESVLFTKLKSFKFLKLMLKFLINSHNRLKIKKLWSQLILVLCHLTQAY